MGQLDFMVSVPAKEIQYSIRQIDIDLQNQMVRLHTEKDGEMKTEWIQMTEVFQIVDDNFKDALKEIVMKLTGIKYEISIPEENKKELFKQTEHALVENWIKPTGAHDAYNTGDLAKFDAVVYRSVIDGNVWDIEENPDGWELD
ncbi:MAG: hypothetical protein ACLFVR_14630 [Thiohalospira sp.]